MHEKQQQQKKNRKKTMGLPTKQNKSLLLHYQPSFPGEKTKKLNKYFIAHTVMLTASLKRGYYDKSKINPRKVLFISSQFISDSHVD